MKTIGRRVNMATLPSLHSDTSTGQGSTCTGHMSAQLRTEKLFSLTSWDFYIRWDWAEGNSWLADVHDYPHLTSLGTGRDIFECLPNSMWSIKGLWSVGMSLKPVSFLCSQADGNRLRGILDVVRVSIGNQVRRVMGGMTVLECKHSLLFYKHILRKMESHWKKMRQDLAHVAGNYCELRIT